MISSVQKALDGMAHEGQGQVVYRRSEAKPTLLKGVTVLPGDGCLFVITGTSRGSGFGEERPVRIPVAGVVEVCEGHLAVQDLYGRVVVFEGRDPNRYRWLWRRNASAARPAGAMLAEGSTDPGQA